MRVLMHICCAPCAIMPVDQLRSEGLELTGFFYNPNIHPYKEFQRRLDTLTDWAGEQELKLIVHDEYALEDWLRQVAFRESMRCNICYHLRLIRTAQVARKGGFDAICSTLLYSIHQKHDLIKQTAEAAARQYGLQLLYRDFRPHWKEGVKRSLESGMYRQPYCGCIYSEKERYYKEKAQRPRLSKTQGKR